MATNNISSDPKLIVCLALAPAIFLGLAFAGAIAITQWFVPGTSGSEAMVMSAVLIGLAGGFIIAKLNAGYAIQSAVYSASFATLLYVSLRLFWFDAPMTLAAAGFVLIVPAALVGAIGANNRKKS
jgi:hypothetical protein